MTDLLSQGIVAARAGKREEARALLMQLVEADERNEHAWLWLAGVVDAPEDIRTCLQNVLDLNPANQQAQQGLAWVEQRYGLALTSRQTADPPAPEAPASMSLPARQVPAPPAPPPEPQRSYTGTTSHLSSAALPIAVAPRSAAPATPIIVPPPEHPCPYCGMPTVLKQQTCTQCRGDLMVRAAPASQRSLALTALGVLWGVGGVLVLLVTVLLLFLFLLLRQSPQPRAAAAGSSDVMLLAITITLVTGMFYLIVARSLLARRLWAYIANIAMIALSFFSTLGGIVVGTLLIGSLLAGVARARNTESAAGTASLIVVAILGIGFVLLPIILTFLSYRDFFGPKVRFQPVVESAEHLVHYNNGIAYKNRGMWYMATQEWEVAVSKKPHETNYLHALGLAYAQLKQFEKARAMLERAIQIAPDNAQIKESRVLIDQMATK